MPILSKSVSLRGVQVTLIVENDGPVQVHVDSRENLIGEGIPHLEIYVQASEESPDEVYSYQDEFDFEDDDELDTEYKPYTESK